MAQPNPQLRINQLAKDLSLKSKDILDIFATELKIEKKSGATVDTDEFDLFIQKMAHQFLLPVNGLFHFSGKHISQKIIIGFSEVVPSG